MPGFSYDISATNRKFITGIDQAIKRAEVFDETLERVTDGQIRYNQAAQRFVNQSGAFVSRARVQELAMQHYADESRRAAEATEEMAGAGKNSRVAMQQLGYAVNDLQQFSYGLSAGIRAVSNNLSAMAVGMGVGGVWVLAIEATATAVALLADNFRGVEESAKDATRAIDEVASAVLKFEGGPGSVTLPRTQRGLARFITERRHFLESIGASQLRQYDTARAWIEENELAAVGTGDREMIAKLKSYRSIVSTLGPQVEGIDRQRIENQEALIRLAAENLAKLRQEEQAIEDLGGANETLNETLNERLRINAALQRLVDVELGGGVLGGKMTPRVGGTAGSMDNRSGVERMADRLGIDAPGIRDVGKAYVDAAGDLREFEAAALAVTHAVEGGLTNAIADLTESLVTGSSVQGVALNALADMAINVGRIAIATGIAVSGIRKALETLNPAAAIGAGAALVALGSYVKSRLAHQAGGGSAAAPSLGTRGPLYTSAAQTATIAPAAAAASAQPRQQLVAKVAGRDLLILQQNETEAQLRSGRVL